MRISLCMIVLNEEYFLPEALMSIQPYVDEMIVVDTGSTDDTISIAREAGAKVISLKTTELDVARNAAIEAATGDWILALDADERMTPDHLKQLRTLAENERNTYALSLMGYNYFGEGLWTGNQIVRFFRRDPRIRWNRQIHETLLGSLAKHKMRVGGSNLSMHHLELDGVDKSLFKRQRNIDRIKSQLKTLSDPTLHCLLGIEYFVMGEVRQAFEQCYIALRMNRSHATALYFLGQFSCLRQDYTQAQRYFSRLLQRANQRQHFAYHGLANIAYQTGDIEGALKFTNLALKKYPTVHYLINKAFLLKELGQTNQMGPLLHYAIIENPFLLDDRIYLRKPEYSTWSIQCSLIPAYMKLQDKKNFWEKVREENLEYHNDLNL